MIILMAFQVSIVKPIDKFFFTYTAKCYTKVQIAEFFLHDIRTYVIFIFL